MAKEEKEEKKLEEGGAKKSPLALLRNPLILVVGNTAIVLGVLGLLVYTKLIYKRPAITEETERARLEHLHAKKAADTTPALVEFEAFTANIRSNPGKPQPADGTVEQIRGKLHYATVGLALEVRDSKQKDVADALKPLIMDKVLAIFGRKQFHEITTVQGRYVLRSQLIDAINQLASKHTKGPLLSNLFFTQFVVQ